MWNNKFPISKPLFDTVKASDFDTVRIPVSYMDKIGNEASGYKIEEAWLNRVQEVVDLAINAGLLVVIDIHHDGSDGVQEKWIDISSDDFETVQTKFTAVWSQIADKFSGYDQRLMFESMNEIKISGQENASDDAYNKINALNQAFVTAVRNAGGKNTDRVLIISGYNTDINVTVNSNFVKPADNKAQYCLYFKRSAFQRQTQHTWQSRNLVPLNHRRHRSRRQFYHSQTKDSHRQRE